MNNPTKLPIRKLIDFMESRAKDPVPTNGKNFFSELLSLAEELEVEELALIGDAHYDGMSKMKELIEEQNLLENTDSYVKEKFDKEFPEESDDFDFVLDDPIKIHNYLFPKATGARTA